MQQIAKFSTALVVLFAFTCVCDGQTILGRVSLEGTGENLSTTTFERIEARRGAVTILFDLTVDGDFRFSETASGGLGGSFLSLNSEDSRIDSFSVSSITDNDPTANYRFANFFSVSLLDPFADGESVTGAFTTASPFFPAGNTEGYTVPDDSVLFVGLDLATSLSLTLDGTNMTDPGLLSLIHISEPTRPRLISYAVFCLKKKT